MDISTISIISTVVLGFTFIFYDVRIEIRIRRAAINRKYQLDLSKLHRSVRMFIVASLFIFNLTHFMTFADKPAFTVVHIIVNVLATGYIWLALRVMQDQVSLAEIDRAFERFTEASH